METERRISTGIDGLDEAIDYLRPGDTVVWQCEHISDYMYVATRFVTNVARKGDRIVYIRFADHEEIMDTAALRERDDTGLVFDAIDDPNTVTVAQVAPAVRAAWAEQFGLDSEFATPKRMVAALRELGFNYVFDTDFAADLTIMEEGSEFIERFTHKDQYQWPMFTSCCPGWVRFEVPVPRTDGQSLHGQVAPADVRCGGEELLCRKGRYRPQAPFRRLDHAVRVEKERMRAADDEKRRGRPRCRREHHDARAEHYDARESH